jgi:hypothetical protein
MPCSINTIQVHEQKPKIIIAKYAELLYAVPPTQPLES